jgi:hypothetical protein
MEAGPEDRLKGTVFSIYKLALYQKGLEAGTEDRIKGTIFIIYKLWQCNRREWRLDQRTCLRDTLSY